MADILGLDQQAQEQRPTTTDYLGAEAPLAFAAQPALPAATGAAGAGGGPSAAPPTIAGEGMAPGGLAGQRTLDPSFGDLSNTVFPGGDVGDPGPAVGLGSPGGLSGLSFTPEGSPIGIGPLGGVTVNTGNPTFDAAMNTIGKAVLGLQGIPTSIPGLISFLSQSPVAGAFSAALGAIGLPFTFINAVHLLSSLSPTTVTSLQRTVGALGGQPNSPDPFGNIAPEEVDAVLGQLSPAQLGAIAKGGNIGPTLGGPVPIGLLPTDAPVGAGASTDPTTGPPGQGSIVAGQQGLPGSVTAGGPGGTGPGGTGGPGGPGGPAGPGEASPEAP